MFKFVIVACVLAVAVAKPNLSLLDTSVTAADTVLATPEVASLVSTDVIASALPSYATAYAAPHSYSSFGSSFATPYSFGGAYPYAFAGAYPYASAVNSYNGYAAFPYGYDAFGSSFATPYTTASFPYGFNTFGARPYSAFYNAFPYTTAAAAYPYAISAHKPTVVAKSTKL